MCSVQCLAGEEERKPAPHGTYTAPLKHPKHPGLPPNSPAAQVSSPNLQPKLAAKQLELNTGPVTYQVPTHSSAGPVPVAKPPRSN